MDLSNDYIEELFNNTEHSRKVILSLLEDQYFKMEQLALAKNEYLVLFEESPVALWEEDFSEVKKYITKNCKDLTKLDSFLSENPEHIYTILSLVNVVNVNNACIDLYKANSKDELLNNLSKVFSIDSINVFKNLLLNLFNNKFELETETLNTTLKGESIYIKLKYKVVPGFEKSFEKVLVSIIDITKEKLIKDKLLQSEQRYIEAQKIAKMGNWTYNHTTNTLKRSDEIYNILEIEKTNINATFEGFLNFIHPDDINHYKTVFNEALINKNEYEVQYRIVTPSKNIKYIVENGQTYYSENNLPLRTVGTAQDITKQVLVEKEIKESQAEYQVLFDNAPIALFEENFTEVVKNLMRLGADENNIVELLNDNSLFQQCLQLIFVNNINLEALKLFKATSKEYFHQNLPLIFTKHSLDVIKEIFIEITLGKSTGSYETTLKNIDGEQFDAIVRFSVLKFKKDTGKLLFSVENITLRKKLLAEIEEKQENLNLAQQIAIIGSFSLYHKTQTIVRTDEFYRIFESTQEQLPTREECFLTFVHKDDREYLINIFHNSIKLKEPYDIEYRIITAKGNLKHINEKGYTTYDNSGNPIKTLGTLQDITERKIAITKVEEAYKIINQSSSIAISWYNHEEFPVKYVSENVETIFGYSVEEFLSEGFHYDSIIFPDDKQRVLSETAYYSNIETPDVFTHEPYRIICKDSSIKWVKDRTVIKRNQQNEVIEYQGFIDDITLQYIAEQETKKISLTLSNTLTSINEGFITFDKNFRYTYVNPQATLYLNKKKEELLGLSLFKIYPTSKNQNFHLNCLKALESQEPIIFEEFYEDTQRWFINRVFPNQEGLSIFFQDITNTKVAHQKLEVAYDIIHKSKTLLYTIKNDNIFDFQYISDNVVNILGYTVEEIYQKKIKFLDIIHPEDVVFIKNELAKYIKSGLRKSYFQPIFRILTKDGTIKYIKDRIDFTLNLQGKIIAFNGIFEDITEQHLASLELEKTNKILNNTLTTITDGFFTLDRNWIYTYINPQAALMLEYNPDELLGKNIWEIDPEIVGSIFYNNCHLAFDTQKPIFYDEFYKPYNKWFENRIYPSNEGISIFFKDITEQKIVIDKIKEASNVINNSNSIAIVWENIPSWPIKYISENVERILGYSVSEMLKEIKDFSVIMHLDDFDNSNKEAFEYIHNTEINYYTLSPYRVHSKDGKIRWISERTTVKRDENGNAIELHGFLDDITEKYILENSINKILNSVSTITGHDYLREITIQLGAVLNADYTFIGLVDSENPLLINTLFNCYEGKVIDNFSYNLSGTPCQDALNLNACSYPSNVSILFPEDYLLSEMSIEGYVGVPLIDSHKNVIGILVGLFKNSINNTDFVESIIQLFSTRIGAEIERLKTEEKLLKAEKAFAQKLLQVNKAINAAKDVVFMTDTKGVFTYINPAFTNLYGYHSDELIGKQTPRILKSGLLTDDDYAKVWNSLFDKKAVNLELKNKNKNGQLIDIESSLSSVINDAGEIVGFVAIQRDITEKKLQKILLQQSEKKYRDLFEKTKNATLLIKDGHFIDCNEATLQMVEFTGNKKDFLNIHPAKLSPLKQPDGRFSKEKADEMMAIAIEKGSHQFEWVHIKQNNKEFYAEVTLTTIEILDDRFIHCVWRDITDKKKADLTKDVVLTIAIQISQVDSIKSFSAIIKQELSSLLDTSNFYIAIYNKEKNTIKIPVSINEDMLDEFDYENEFNADGTLTGYVISTKKPLLATTPIFNKLEKLNKIQLVGAPSKIWLGVPLFNKKEVIGAIAVQSYTDENAYTETDQKTLEIVSEQIAIALERIQSQTKIQENELKFRTIFELSPDMVNLVSADGILLDCNEQLVYTLGYENKNELVGQPFIKLFAHDDVENAKEKFAGVLETGFTQNQEHVLIKKDGTEFTVEISATLNYDEQNNPLNVIGIARDITERKHDELLKEVLLNISKRIANSNSLGEFSIIVKQELAILLNTENFYLGLYNEKDDTITVPFFADELEHEFQGNDVFPAKGSASGYVVKTKKPLLATNDDILNLIKKKELVQLGPVSAVWLGVPLTVHNTVIGIIAVQSYTNPSAYTTREQKIMEIVADQIGVAIERIQSKQQINENEEKFRTIFELSPDMVNLVDLEGNLLDCNQELVKQLGYNSKDELIGRNYLKRFLPNQINSVSSKFNEVISKGQILNQEYIMTRKDGTTFPAEISAVLNYDEHNLPKNIIGIGRDITQRKLHEDAMAEALEKATQADRLKSAFLANMSHEIRTPMNGIIGFAEMLKNKELSEDKRAFYANIIMNSSKQLLSIINDVLDMSTIEAGLTKLNYEAVSINSMLTELHMFFSKKFEEKGLDLIVKLPLENDNSVVLTDSTKVQQILTNLINNALKFTKVGSVTIGYQLTNNFLEFYVKDTGKGIEEKYHQEIFERFKQVNQEYTKETIGNGLGLSICSRYVELLGGKIWLTSEIGKGSNFHFTLPYNKAELINQEHVVLKEKLNTYTMKESITILVAEDEEYNQIFIEEILDDHEIEIHFAENGIEAVDIAKNNPDIKFILMDIKMPVMNGIEASKKIKEFNPTVPIIALTAFSMESDRKYLLSEGFDDYLAKPILKKDLLTIINKFGSSINMNL